MSVIVFRTAAAVFLLAGTAYGQFTYTGASPGGSEWSRNLNWAGGAAPAVGGGTDLIATMGPAPANRRVVNLVDRNDAMNPAFNLNRLVFAANANGRYEMQGSDLRFNNSAVNGGAVLAHNTNDVRHLIDNNIILNTNLRFEGTANNVVAAPELRLDGVISQAGNINYGLTFVPTQAAMRYRVNGANTYAGTTTINNGVVVLTGNSNLGTGPLLSGSANAAHVQTITALSGFNAVLANSSFELTRNVNIGEAGLAAASSIRVNGEFRPGVGANQAREVNLNGGRNHELILANEIVLNGQATLVFNGDVAPNIQGGKIFERRFAQGMNPVVRKSESLGSVVRITGEQTAAQANNRQVLSMAGALTVRDATLSVETRVGSNAARIQNVWNIGAAARPAALIGRSVLNGAGVDPARVFFAQGRQFGLRVANGSILQPGASPGQLALNGGTHEFEPGSAFSVTLNGATPGNGDGYYGQLLLEEGAEMSLLSSGSFRPVLGIGLETYSETGSPNFSPSIGMSFTIIDQDSPFAPSLYSPADPFGNGGTMFMSHAGNALSQGVYVYNENLPSGMYFQIDYFGGDTGNDVVLTIVPIPTPGAAGLLLAGGLLAARRRR